MGEEAFNGTCPCPLVGTVYHELVHLTWSNRIKSSDFARESDAYDKAAKCFGKDCEMPLGLFDREPIL